MRVILEKIDERWKSKIWVIVFASYLPLPLLLLKFTSSSSTSVTLLILAHPYPIDFSNQHHISSSHRQPFLVIRWKPLWEAKKQQRTAHERKSHFTLGSNFLSSLWFKKQVTWGYNIVAMNGQGQITLIHTMSQLKFAFSRFQLFHDRPTDQRTNRQNLL